MSTRLGIFGLIGLVTVMGCNKLPLISLNSDQPAVPSMIADGELYILVAGQSNGVSPAQGVGPQASSTGRVYIQHKYQGQPVQFVPSPGNESMISISWIYLGDMIARERKLTVHIINVAAGNTSTRKWKDYLYSRIDEAMASYPIGLVLWVQGESDYEDEISNEESYANLKWVIEHSRKIRNVSWYVAIDTVPTDPSKDWLGTNDRVVKAQERVINEGLARRGPNLMDLHTPGMAESTLGEFQGYGLMEHANRWFQILRADIR